MQNVTDIRPANLYRQGQKAAGLRPLQSRGSIQHLEWKEAEEWKQPLTLGISPSPPQHQSSGQREECCQPALHHHIPEKSYGAGEECSLQPAAGCFCYSSPAPEFGFFFPFFKQILLTFHTIQWACGKRKTKKKPTKQNKKSHALLQHKKMLVTRGWFGFFSPFLWVWKMTDYVLLPGNWQPGFNLNYHNQELQVDFNS